MEWGEGFSPKMLMKKIRKILTLHEVFWGHGVEDIFCPAEAKIAKSSPEHLPPLPSCSCQRHAVLLVFAAAITAESAEKHETAEKHREHDPEPPLAVTSR